MKKKQLSARQLRMKGYSLWQEVPTTSWLQFLSEVKPRPGMELKLKGDSIMSHCVAHSDTNPSMHINLKKGFAHCFACSYHERDAISFTAKFINRDKSVAIKQLQSILDVKLVTPTEAKQLDADNMYTTMKNCLASIMQDELVEAKNAWDLAGHNEAAFLETKYYASLETLKFLDHRIGLDNIVQVSLGIMPSIKELREKAALLIDPKTKSRRCSPQMLDMMERYIRDYSTPNMIGKLVLIYHAAPGVVSRFRIRFPDNPDGSKNFLAIEDEREAELGLFGFDLYGDLGHQEDVSATKVIMVEGEFDVLAYKIRAMAQGNTDVVVLAHGGSGNQTFPELSALKISKVYYLQDHDPGGDANAKAIMRNNPEHEFRIFQWPTALLDPNRDKLDLDDAIQLHGFDIVHEEITKWDLNWALATYWCKEQVRQQVSSRGLDGDQEAIRRLIFDYAACVGAHSKTRGATAQNWIRTSLEDYGFTEDVSKKLTNDFLAQASEESVFCLNIEKKLRERYFFIGIDHRRSTLPIHAWDKKKKFTIEVRMGSESHIKASLAISLGSLVDWVKEEISIPGFIKYGPDFGRGDASELSIIDQEEKITKFVFYVLKTISATLKPLTDYKYHSTGVHWIQTESDGMCAFIVNGKTVHKLKMGEDGVKDFSVLESPIHEGHYFDSSKSTWTDHITDSASLQATPVMSLAESFNLCQGMVSEGWAFKSQWADSCTIAAFAVVASICKIFPQNLQFLASNERGTGKSTLCAEFFGGGKNTDINIIEHSKYYDNATAAGVRQTADGSSLIQIFDEVDNEGGDRYRAHKNEELMTILRTSSAGDGIYLQGTVGGEPRVFRLAFSSMVSGINPGVNAANMSRFITIDLRSGLDNKLPPRTSILQKYTLEDIARLRKTITLDRFNDIPHILRCYDQVNEESDRDPTIFGKQTMQRAKENMKIIAAILLAAGVDWKKWAAETLKSKDKAMKSLAKRTSNENLIQTILHTPSIEFGKVVPRRMMVAQFFRTTHIETDRAALNRSGNGVYLLKDEDFHWYLMIVWQEAVRGVLKGTSALKAKDDTHVLQEIAARHPNCLDADTASKLLETTLLEIPAYVEDVPYSILDVTDLVAREERRYERARETMGDRFKEPEPLISID